MGTIHRGGGGERTAQCGEMFEKKMFYTVVTSTNFQFLLF